MKLSLLQCGVELQSKQRAARGDHEAAREAAGKAALLRAKKLLSTGWAARLCCEQRGHLAAVSSRLLGVRQRVQAVGSARKCARERATRERSGSQSSSVCLCGHSPKGAIARVLGPTQWSSIGGCCSRPRTNAEMIWCKCSRPMGQRTFGVRMRGVITSQVIQNLGIPAETQESRNKKVCVPRRLSVGHRREKLSDWLFSSTILMYALYPSGCRERLPYRNAPCELENLNLSRFTRNVSTSSEASRHHICAIRAFETFDIGSRRLKSTVCLGILLELLRIWCCRAQLLSLGWSPHVHFACACCM